MRPLWHRPCEAITASTVPSRPSTVSIIQAGRPTQRAVRQTDVHHRQFWTAKTQNGKIVMIDANRLQINRSSNRRQTMPRLLASLGCLGVAIAPTGTLAFLVGPPAQVAVRRRATVVGGTDLAAHASDAIGDEDDAFIPMSPEKRPPPQGGDMAYLRDNITRQMDVYLQIRKAGWPEDDCINDIYVRNPQLSSFWFVGKVARCTGTVSLEQAVARQWNLIEEHATRLRPMELGRCFGTCEVWVSSGDSEIDMSENNPNNRLQKMERVVEGSDSVNNFEVGLNLEVVTNRGAGFFVVRNDDGMVPPELMQ